MYSRKHIIEYIIFRAITAFVRILPVHAALGVGWIIAWTSFVFFGWRVKPAMARIREVFKDRFDEREVRRIAWLSLRNTAFSAIEVLRIPSLSDRWIARYTNFPESPGAAELLSLKGGAIMALPHMGSWDMGGVAASIVGVPIFFITGTQKNPLFDSYVNRMRGVTGIETIPRDSKSLLRQVIRNLRKGRVLAFTNDLRAKTKAMSVQFLGSEANIVGGMALFARQANVPVYPLYLTREGWTYHRVTFGDPIFPNPDLPKEEDWQRITQEVMTFFDKAIRAHPEQYFWYNKRWVLDPLDEDDKTPAA